MSDLASQLHAMQSPRDVRMEIRNDRLRGSTSGLAPGYLQANLVVVPQSAAFDFLLFCHRNPKPCPILEVLDAGSAEPRATAPEADLRTDLGRYRVFEHGQQVDEP